jgi:hypothetical protein
VGLAAAIAIPVALGVVATGWAMGILAGLAVGVAIPSYVVTILDMWRKVSRPP